ncbi:NPC intracellular cholesterol transporter 2-like [Branchiostoma lanceolatum]|uniref:NPC intracellular cholesterol transporter 2 n=1 Tax=Branchiostoma lanceolatum TaxID=7740 RepID=A0A8K0ET51_BRALA|nr:NPC2 [Branchiostoma lanceolatum]
MLKGLIFVGILAAFATSDNVVFKDCGSKMGAISTVNVTPCPNEPCLLKKGSNISVEVTFSTKEEVTKASTGVYAVLLGQKLPFPNFPYPDGCKDSGLSCPLKSGGTFKYNSTLHVDSDYPTVKVVVWWQLTDQNGDMVYCFEVPAQITK